MQHKICSYIFNKYNFTASDILAKNGYGEDLLLLCCCYMSYVSLKYVIIKYKFTHNDLKHLEVYNYRAKTNKILFINNLLNCKKYNKIFDLIYK